MATTTKGYLNEIALEEENENLKYKIEILETAVREIKELMNDSAGVYWNRHRDGSRSIGNLFVNRWHELDENLSYFNEAIDFLEQEKEDN